jgi:hypothetical protein
MKICILCICSFLLNCSLKLLSSSDIVNIQDEIISYIENNTEFDINDAISKLDNNFIINEPLAGLNAVSTNNIAVRNSILLSLLYFKNGNEILYNQYLNKSKKLIEYNLIDNSIWNEGPGYYLYTEASINAYIKVTGDTCFNTIKHNCHLWISKYITPNNKLPPIGDTRASYWKFSEYNNRDTLIYDKEQTLYKYSNIYLLIRHPSKINKYKNNGHTNFDIASIVMYKLNTPIILHSGYPGYQIKSKDLNSIRYQNGFYFDSLSNITWRLNDIKLISVNRFNDSIHIVYKFSGNTISRSIKLHSNSIDIIDTGTNGINLNLSDNTIVSSKYEIVNSISQHEEDGKLVLNRRILVKSVSNFSSCTINL